MELAEREGQAGRLRREPGNDEGSGETRNEPPLRGDRNGLLLLPPSAAVWTQKGRIYITYRRTDRTTKDSLAQQVWVRERRESTTEPIFRALCAAYIIDIPILLSIAFGCIGEMNGSSEAIFVGQFTRTIRLRESESE